MEIGQNAVVAFRYRLLNDQGQQLEASAEETTVYLHGAGGMLPGLEQALQGKAAGDQVTVTLEPHEAYGAKHPDSVQRIPLKHLRGKKKPRPGDVVAVNGERGPRQVTIVKVGKFMVEVDTNHPLAGMVLTFVVDIVEVRPATAEELAHGHVHGPGGHHH